MKLDDGNIIECVLMKYKFGLSVCISSQVGCLMGCTFCASTIGSKVRDLSSGEMIGQILAMSNDVGEKISNVVIMGSGEPFDNYENLLKFFDLRKIVLLIIIGIFSVFGFSCSKTGNEKQDLVMSKDTLNIGARHITVSTCGLADKIIDFADRKLQINLAISLHNPSQEKRSQIMPISRKFNIQELMEAVEYYISKTNRRVTYEYALINKVNDSEEDAKLLVKLVKKQLCHINLIPVNSTEHSNYRKPDNIRIQNFMNILSKNGINATIRREMGTDINGACGQLRISAISKEKL